MFQKLEATSFEKFNEACSGTSLSFRNSKRYRYCHFLLVGCQTKRFRIFDPRFNVKSSNVSGAANLAMLAQVEDPFECDYKVIMLAAPLT